MAGQAAEELWQARSLVARCNAAFFTVNKASDPNVSSKKEELPHDRWETAHGFCLNMNGVLLQTKDGWTYPVHSNNAVPLIMTGILKPSHLRIRDIQDRAKADSFAKAFTLLQSSWVTCNIIARRAYNLPISALEISTVAYCAAIAYLLWWHKPRDMVTPVIVYLPYGHDHEDMPRQVKDISDKDRTSWVHSDDIAVILASRHGKSSFGACSFLCV